MEPIVLCGFVIVMFGVWVEFEPTVRVVVKIIFKSKFFTKVASDSTVQKPVHVYVRKMPICVAKAFYC